MSHTHSRLPFIDWLRGFAIALMVIYHFCYDLYFFKFWDIAFGKGLWIPFRYVIVVSFLALVGVSLVLVHSKGMRWNNMLKRSGQLALASAFVTASSYFVAPEKLTIFGILHFILVASWMAIPFLSRPLLALVAGILVFIVGHTVKGDVFSSIWLHWLGMMPEYRPALDYVPVFPWFGMVLIGVYLGHQIMERRFVNRISAVELTEYDKTGLSSLLQWAGKHSLVIYLAHQPILFGGFYLFKAITS